MRIPIDLIKKSFGEAGFDLRSQTRTIYSQVSDKYLIHIPSFLRHFLMHATQTRVCILHDRLFDIFYFFIFLRFSSFWYTVNSNQIRPVDEREHTLKICRVYERFTWHRKRKKTHSKCLFHQSFFPS